MTDAVLSIDRLRKSFGGLTATDGVTVDIAKGSLHAIIGPNGAGKSTLINQIMGEIKPDSGRILFNGEDVTELSTPQRVRRGMARSFQVTRLCLEFTVLENVLLASQMRDRDWVGFWRPATSYDRAVGRACEELEKVGLGDKAEQRAQALSHGAQKQLEIAMALASDPALLLLDEPLAGLGREESDEMVALLDSMKGGVTMLLIEHDMEAVFTLADRISVLSFGKLIASGTVADIKQDAAVRDAYLGTEA